MTTLPRPRPAARDRRAPRAWIAAGALLALAAAPVAGVDLPPATATATSAAGAAADAATDVPDEFGLGERLALVSWLRDHGAPPADPEDLAALRRDYNRLAHPAPVATPAAAVAGGAPAPAANPAPVAPVDAAPAADAAPAGASARRKTLLAAHARENITPDPALTDDQLQALLDRLEDEDRRHANDSTTMASPLAGPQVEHPYNPLQPGAPGGSAAAVRHAEPPTALVRARATFTTRANAPAASANPPPTPPASAFTLVTYDAAPGALWAYLTPDPGDHRRHPAIIWLTGGDTNTIGDVWTAGNPLNDQTAAAFRYSGVVMMFPSLRGGNNNPGAKEMCLGEVDDVLNAADALAAYPYVDPARIYLGGHSSGGTLALLTAESTHRFRAVFSFGPVGDIGAYGQGNLPFDAGDAQEIALRSPRKWLSDITTPVYVIEGANGIGNVQQLSAMQAAASANEHITWVPVAGCDHFTVLHRACLKLAETVAKDDGQGTFRLTAYELASATMPFNPLAVVAFGLFIVGGIALLVWVLRK
jgi:acetyl esterase/lipase